MTDSLSQEIRAAISNAYYDARNNGQTMEAAADDATAAVMRLITPRDLAGIINSAAAAGATDGRAS